MVASGYRFPTPFEKTVGPFVGMNDTKNLEAQDATRAAYLENVYSPQGPVGGDLISRPGFYRWPLGTAVARTGTATSIAMTAGVTGYTITGSSTLFTTELAVGDILVSASGAEAIVTAIASATSLTATCEVAGTFAGALTYYPAGIKTGPIYGVWLSLLTTGTVREFLIASTSAIHKDGAAAGKYHFVDTTASTTALTGTVSTFPNGSATVTGTGTLFLSELAVGDILVFADLGGISGGGFYSGLGFLVSAIATNTSLTVNTVNTGAGAAGAETMTKNTTKLQLVQFDPSDTTHPFTDRTSSSMNRVDLDTSNRIAATTFSDSFILSDGTNRPRKISSTFVLANLTDANYAFYGALTVYSGKLFGIDASNRVTIRWSDENDPDTGWGTGSSPNSWTLRQTSVDQLVRLLGTNDALYVWRQNSITSITGNATTDFASASTQEAVSTTVGTRSWDTCILVQNVIYFLDQYGQPGLVIPGQGYVSLYDRIVETLRPVATTNAQLLQAWAQYDPVTLTVRMGLRWTSGATTNAYMLVFDARTTECLGLHDIPSVDHAYGSVLLDSSSRPMLTVATGGTSDIALYTQRTETDQTTASQDYLSGGETTVACTVQTPRLMGDTTVDKKYVRIDVNGRDVTGTEVVLKVNYTTPLLSAFSTAQTMDTGSVATGYPDKWVVGIDADGRWCQLQFQNDTTGAPQSRFTLGQLTLAGYAFSIDPATK